MTNSRLVANLIIITVLWAGAVTTSLPARGDDTRADDPSSHSWEPHRTWAFIVGILEWKDSESFPSFPKELRRDAELVKVLTKAGVPRQQIVYLQDKQATTAAVSRALPELLRRANPGDWVLVYYAGHGYKDESGKAYVATYDAEEGELELPMREIPAAIDEHFKGGHVVIALDNCYSGSMVDLVSKTHHRTPYGVFASSSASSLSTGNWTFTESLLAALTGSAIVDTDHNGEITFAETAAYIESEMLFGEEQLAVSSFTDGFDAKTSIAKSGAAPGRRIGEHVEGLSEGDWYRGYVIDTRQGALKIHYYGYEKADDEWLPLEKVRTAKLVQYQKGERVQVEWEGKWYDAKILDVRDGVHQISYDKYDSTWDEWVASGRIRAGKSKGTAELQH